MPHPVGLKSLRCELWVVVYAPDVRRARNRGRGRLRWALALRHGPDNASLSLQRFQARRRFLLVAAFFFAGSGQAENLLKFGFGLVLSAEPG